MSSQERRKVIEEQLVLKTNGEPFESVNAATKANPDKDIYTPVTVDGGYGLLPNEFVDEWNVDTSDAPGVMAGADEAPTKVGAGKASAKPALLYPEGYVKVYFHAKSTATDHEDVSLSHNGQNIVIQRQKEVTIPKRFIEIAEHAVYSQFKQLPGESRKVIAQVRKFPFEIRGEGTEEDYLKQIRDGTKKTKEAIQKDLNAEQK